MQFMKTVGVRELFKTLSIQTGWSGFLLLSRYKTPIFNLNLLIFPLHFKYLADLFNVTVSFLAHRTLFSDWDNSLPKSQK